jgi:hypothetical protein
MSTTSGNTAIIEHLRARVAQLEAELAEARTDPVTSLPTRRHLARLPAPMASTAMPRSWISDQVEYVHTGDQLEVSVDELRRRYPAA